MTTVSIIIPTRNRKSTLFNTISRLITLADPLPEIIIYDDASEEDYAKEIGQHFPMVKFFRTTTRVGPCELRNKMITASSGELIISLDDDSYFATDEDYERALNIIAKSKGQALIGFKIINKNGVAFPFREKGSLYQSDSFIGCGFMAPKRILSTVGGFDPLIFRAGEERDMSIRLLDKGFDVNVSTAVEVFHEESDRDRNHQSIHGYAFRNELYFYLKYFPVISLPFFIIACTMSHAIFCIRRSWYRAYWSGLMDFIKKFSVLVKNRKPVKIDTCVEYLKRRLRLGRALEK